ncbi:MAG: tRNA-binding protein [Nanoarchaeota archaeon]|nr:tRNA-binding protein [Nanoarchaeota archaeon]MBU4124429.1 tRNA-binding protein [Nanoarchaeota archaeon]
MQISWDDFQNIEIRVGTIIKVEPFLEARTPAYKVWVDFGELGVKKSSAQITKLYSQKELVGKQVICVINFKPKQIANFVSEILITGFVSENDEVILVQPERKVRNGLRLA